jgi:hypothetical protein
MKTEELQDVIQIISGSHDGLIVTDIDQLKDILQSDWEAMDDEELSEGQEVTIKFIKMPKKEVEELPEWEG